MGGNKIAKKISGIQRLLDDVGQKAQTYRTYLVRQIEAVAAGGNEDWVNEPPPIPIRTMEILDEEIRRLNKLIWKGDMQLAHLFQPYSDFGPKYHESYDGQYNFLDGKTLKSLKHDYTGIGVWVNQTQAYLIYLIGAAEIKIT